MSTAPTHVVVGVLAGLHHRLGHDGPEGLEPALEARDALARLAEHDAGLLVDGAWALRPDAASALELALAWSSLDCAVGLAQGHVRRAAPPLGLPLLDAAHLARTGRIGEVLAPLTWVERVELPRGVGRFAAPEGLLPHGHDAAVVLRDFRG